MLCDEGYNKKPPSFSLLLFFNEDIFYSFHYIISTSYAAGQIKKLTKKISKYY